MDAQIVGCETTLMQSALTAHDLDTTIDEVRTRSDLGDGAGSAPSLRANAYLPADCRSRYE